MPTWHEYLTDAQVAQMNVDTTHGTGDAVHGDVLRDSRVEGDTISDVDTDGTTST